jgi:hypothetical protein
MLRYVILEIDINMDLYMTFIMGYYVGNNSCLFCFLDLTGATFSLSDSLNVPTSVPTSTPTSYPSYRPTSNPTGAPTELTDYPTPSPSATNKSTFS